MALEKSREFSSKENKQHCNDNFKSKVKRDKSFQTKVIVRRLPPTMIEEQFLEQISPLPDHDYMYFVKADMRLGQNAFSRAYINFINPEDIFIFKEKFDDYVFLDTKGNEYPAIVEFAPFQKIPKKRSKKRDAKSGTITNDPDYLKFFENLKNPDEVTLQPTESLLEEIETRDKELKSNNGVPKMTTPLIEYLKARKVEQQKIREEKREERKRKELEKKRIREEERRRRKAEKDKERTKDKFKDKDSVSEKETTDDVDESSVSESIKPSEPIVQVLKNPEREKEQKEHVPFQKSKDYFVNSRYNKEKDRTRVYNVRERDYGRTSYKQRTSERSGYVRDKDRSRKDKTDYKLYVGRKSIENSKDSSKKSKDSKSQAINENPDDISAEVDFSENIEKAQFSPKDKRDNSCPGNVEPSVSKKEDDGFSNNQYQTVVKSMTCEEIMESNSNSKHDSFMDDGDQGKDPRAERRIRNKDRPSLAIYQPGMRRFNTQRSSPQKEISTSASNSSSPSPTPPLVSIAPTKTVPKNGEKNDKKTSTDDKSSIASGKISKRSSYN